MKLRFGSLCSMCLGILLCAATPGSAGTAGDEAPMGSDAKIIFLHRSIGQAIWDAGVVRFFRDYNMSNGTRLQVTEQAFPKRSRYGWKNYPYDCWNIWVKRAGMRPFKGEPTLELLTRDSDDRRIENYKVQYNALEKKMHEFPENRFIVWTGPALVRNATSPSDARRAKAFFDWVRSAWDEEGDNIYLWDFSVLETRGGLYLRDEYAAGPGNSHPSRTFARKVAPYFCRRIVDVLEGKGDSGSKTGR